MAAPTVTVSGTALSLDAAGTPIAANLTGGVAGDIAVVFIALDQNLQATITANGTGWTKRVDVVSSVFAWPTAGTTGIQGATLTTVNLGGANALWRTSVEGQALNPTHEVIGGNTYDVYSNYDFPGSTQYVAIDSPYVKFIRCRFVWSSYAHDIGSMTIMWAPALAAIYEDCTFDGGAAYHNRAILGDNAHITVRRCNFTRFGNAAIEKNDRTGTYDLDVSDSYFAEVKGWQPVDHVDAIQMGCGRNFTVHHNTMFVEPYGGLNGDTAYVSNSCIGLWAELGDVTGTVMIDNNLMAGGGACIYIQAKPPYNFLGACTITNNVFDRTAFASIPVKAAIYFTLYPNGIPAQLVWSQNTFEDGTVLTQAQAVL